MCVLYFSINRKLLIRKWAEYGRCKCKLFHTTAHLTLLFSSRVSVLVLVLYILEHLRSLWSLVGCFNPWFLFRGKFPDDILYRCTWFPEDESSWLYWSADLFFCVGNGSQILGHIQFDHEIWPSDPQDQRQSFVKYITRRCVLNINMLEHFVERVELSVRAAVNPWITAESHIFKTLQEIRSWRNRISVWSSGFSDKSTFYCDTISLN